MLLTLLGDWDLELNICVDMMTTVSIACSNDGYVICRDIPTRKISSDYRVSANYYEALIFVDFAQHKFRTIKSF